MTTPQEFLDQLNAIEIDSLLNANASTKGREAFLKVAKQKLRLIKGQLKREQSVIKKRWDGRNAYEAAREEIELAPYSLIENAILHLETNFAEIDACIKTNTPLPTLKWVGNTIVGGLEYGEWIITERAEAAAWLKQKRAEILKQKFATAKHHIQSKNYQKARLILVEIEHPEAQKWLGKLDKLEARQRRRKQLLWVVLLFLSVAIIALFYVATNP